MTNTITWESDPILNAEFDFESYDDVDEYDRNPQRAVLTFEIQYTYKQEQYKSVVQINNVKYFPAGEGWFDFGNAMTALSNELHADITRQTGKRLRKNWIGTKGFRAHRMLHKGHFQYCDIS